MKHLFILGSCGSIGTQTLDIVRKNKNDFKVIGISVGRNLDLAQQIIDEFNPEIVCFRKKEDISMVETNAISVYGDEGLISVSQYGNYPNSVLVNALVGAAGLKPTVEAIKCKKDIALANKETLVMAGDIINEMIVEYNVNLYPIDSEHSAIWQCLTGEKIADVNKIIITASGGSFRDRTREQLIGVTVEEALNHPNWSMGSKITIDSATMMNKGFEVIEAHHLFHLPYDKIDTVLHRQSIIHSFVEYNDSAIKAVLGTPDMRIPILYALTYPNHKKYSDSRLDIAKMGDLTFEELSQERYPCLGFAYDAGRKGGVYPTVLNAANEAAVKLFLEGKIEFLDIESIISLEINKEYSIDNPSLEDILNINELVFSSVIKRFGGN